MQRKIAQAGMDEQDFRSVARMRRRGVRSVIGSVLAGGLALSFAGPASAATITPSTFADEFGTGGACSLREAVQSANTNTAFSGCSAGSGADAIRLQAGTYVLALAGSTSGGGDLDVESNVTISYQGIGQSVIRSNVIDRVLEVDAGNSVVLSGVTIRGGELPNDLNPATPDPAGGGILNQGTLTLLNSTVTDNFSRTGGGGIQNVRGVTTLTNVTVSGNRADSNGGGIRNVGGTLTLNNVTVTDNVADRDNDGSGNGGGVQAAKSVTGDNGTPDDPSDDPFIAPNTLFNNTIVAENTDRGGQAPDCDRASGTPSIGSGGNNLIGTLAGCVFAGPDSDLVGPAGIGRLTNNGGSTFTHALSPASQAVNNGGADSTAADQRGVARKNADIGAYELARCGGVIVNRVGTSAGQTLIGTSGADGILGFGGNDRLLGLNGNDGLCGGTGNDTLKGGGGGDKLFGNSGRDRLLGGKGNDLCVGGPGKDKRKSC